MLTCVQIVHQIAHPSATQCLDYWTLILGPKFSAKRGARLAGSVRSSCIVMTREPRFERVYHQYPGKRGLLGIGRQ
jgi:hypothetical protein